MFNIEFAIFYIIFGVVFGAISHRAVHPYLYRYSEGVTNFVTLTGIGMWFATVYFVIDAGVTYGFGWGALTLVEIFLGSALAFPFIKDRFQ